MSDLIYTGKRLPSAHEANFEQILKKVSQRTKKEFPYTQRITRHCPTAFIFLIDQSYSMNDTVTVGSDTQTKAEFLSTVINQTLNEMIDRCKKGAEIRDYFQISLIGYGGDEDNTAKILWEGNLSGKTFVTPSELLQNYTGKKKISTESQRPDGSIKQIEKTIYYWIDPKAAKQTPMRQAFLLAHDILVQWIHENPTSYPPTVINITDGQATDCTRSELYEAAGAVQNLFTEDGNVIAFNIHVSNSADNPVYFPCIKSELPQDDKFASLLFDISSDLPSHYNHSIAKLTQKDLIGSYTAMVINAPISKLISLLNIGTNTNLLDNQ